jgi:hypothetical protein
MAGFFGGWPHEIWSWPLHYYLSIRKEYLKIVNPSRDDDSGASGERVTERRVVGPGIVVETYERPG